jgi:magnesium-transporting ATPase (P-type)
MGIKNNAGWHAKPYEEVIDSVGSSEKGLTSEEAKSRFQKYGPNHIKRKQKDGPLNRFVEANQQSAYLGFNRFKYPCCFAGKNYRRTGGSGCCGY